MDTEINEPVKVWAFFDPSTGSGQVAIFPIAISWRRRLIKLHKLIFFNAQRVGREKILRLICAGEGANYVLEYNTATYNWKLKKVTGKE